MTQQSDGSLGGSTNALFCYHSHSGAKNESAEIKVSLFSPTMDFLILPDNMNISCPI